MKKNTYADSYTGPYSSVLKPYLEQYILLMHEQGKVFKVETWYLRKIDIYCVNQELKKPFFTRNFIQKWCSTLESFPKSTKEMLLRLTRSFSAYLGTLNVGSFVLPGSAKKEYKTQSILASYIEEFINGKRGEGLKYTGESLALKSFDRYCCTKGLHHVSDLTESFVRDWHISRSAAPNHKDYVYAVRHLMIFLKMSKHLQVDVFDRRFKEAHPCLRYSFASAFSSFLTEFVAHKKATGFKYESQEKILRYFDLLCIDSRVTEPVLSRDIVQRWMVLRPSESEIYRIKRVSVIRQFARFLISRGQKAYIAPCCPSATSSRPHIFRDEELVDFFACSERYTAENPITRLTLPVIFRFYYCMGLRLNEAAMLSRGDVDLDSGKVKILGAKLMKDRLVYMPEALLALARKYDLKLQGIIPGRHYFFASDLLGSSLSDTSLCKHFTNIWNMTGFAETVDKKPTIHCFRHSMVVRKLEEWFREKVDYTYWLPYLSAYLGHTSLEDTYHYITLVDSSFPLIRDSMKLFEGMYPQEAIR
jgi:integrase